ncbi:MAG: methyltransferase domain-containing protein [Proteobacteria bacterium]|nr:methyltransferase domain-containing protein [Pseudomonadota bacterium]NIS72583.1 methyltransferase domain-containing protein [Pseudomonadota bacterium]
MKLNWAEKWAVNNPLRVMIQSQIIRWMKRLEVLGPEAVVSEVGCGRGAGADLLLKVFQPKTFYALDLDLTMIQKARKYLSQAQGSNICLCVGNVEHLPYGDGALDAVFSFGVLHHALDWRTGLAEIARVLKTRGVYFFEELYPSLYQNFITRRIFRHPEKDRFVSREFKEALKAIKLEPLDCLEREMLGILGVYIKKR